MEPSPTARNLDELDRDSWQRWNALATVALALAVIVAILYTVEGLPSPFPSPASGPALLFGLCALIVMLCIVLLAREREARRLRAQLIEARLAEAMLIRQREAALEAGRMKTEFLANMSHELRTPLTGIVGVTELLFSTPLEPRQREFLETSKHCADALQRIVDDILDFSQLEGRGLELEAIPFGLRGCIASAIRTLAPRAERKGLELDCYIAGDLPDALVGDPARLREILLHLAGNAIKFTDHGQVTLRVALESELDRNLLLRVSVVDTGIGIPLEKQRLVFAAFTQVDGSSTRAHGGAGLGLAIASRLVEMMGGRIGVESEPNRGSTFWFTARFGVAPRAAGGRALLPAPSLRERRVLVVDDNPTNRKIFAEMLESWRMHPSAVPDADTALGALRTARDAGQPFDLLLLDARMPDTSGLELANRLQAESDLRVPVVVITSAAQPGDARAFREAGVAGYLPKPIVGTDLFDTIRVVLGRESMAPEMRPFVTRHWLRENLGQRRILFLEGDAESRPALVELLERRGFQVLAPASAKEAQAAVQTGDIDVAVIDLASPAVEGLAAAGALRARTRATGRHIPMIATEAAPVPGGLGRAPTAECDLSISRPIASAELIAAIDAAISAVDPREVEDLGEAPAPPAESGTR